MRSVLLLLVAIVLAGCSAEGPRAEAAPAAAAAPAESGSPAPAAEPQSPEPVRVDLPFERQGRTWTTACVVVLPVAGHCQHLVEGSDITEWLPEDGTPVAFAGTITWSEGNADLGIGLVVEAEDGTPSMASHEHYASGPSPLAFSFDLAAVGPGRIGFHVGSYAGAGTPEARVDVSPGQDWSLAGTVTVLQTP